MYVTRPLSLYRDSPSVSMPPPEGPNSGILVIQDQEENAELRSSRWCGLFKKKESVKTAPFPQNKILQLTHSAEAGEFEYSESVYAVMIPVLNQPLSSNQYYIINARGNRKGLACTSSKADETSSSKCCYTVPDPPPQLFDPKNQYQQFQISDYVYCGGASGFICNSVAQDGVSPLRLSRNGWRAYIHPLNDFHEPTPAHGLNAQLRARLPDLNFSLPCKSSDPVAVGKWYSPFIFIRDGNQAVGSQMTNSPYYEITLHQNWVEIFGCENNGVAVGNVDVFVEREVVSGESGASSSKNVVDGIVWFEPLKVGLSLVVVERMKWEEDRGGFKWVQEGEEKKVRVVKERLKLKEMGKKWTRFGCYVLVERFVVKRMDGSLVLTWEFRHTHQVTTKWE
ncbi:uncharacterized protein LOC101216291 [Cucumis sativus]|uniref:Insecticidal crystal toxin domain-containing protein n=1 Tax=Cucumis sativus TaxID=3659 RepID=A0A0A0KT31_CUCSA|nr:uncharacterized protein LOC101216291 [Cucumis sativus]